MKKSFLKLHIAIVLAGFTGVFGKLITLNEGLLVWYRMAISSILLVLILGFFKKLNPVTAKQFMAIAMAGFLLGLHWVFFYGSIKYANISIGVVCFSMAGFFTAVLTPVITRKPLNRSELLLSGLTLIGIALIFSFDTQYRIGISLGIISSLLVTLYTIANEQLAQSYPSETITTYQMIGGSIGLGALLPFYLHFFPVTTLLPSWSDAGYLVLLAFFCTILLYLLLTQALRQLSAFTVNLSFNLEPVYTIALAILIYNENRELTTPFYTGLGLIILSVILQMLKVTFDARKTFSNR